MRHAILSRLFLAALGAGLLPTGVAAAQQAETAQASPSQGTAWLNRQMAALAERNGADARRVTPSRLRWPARIACA